MQPRGRNHVHIFFVKICSEILAAEKRIIPYRLLLLQNRLSDEVCGYTRFFLHRRRYTGRLSGFYTLQQPRHISAEIPHGLQTFRILPDLIRRIAVNHIPIAGCGNRHLLVQEVFVHLIECGGRPGAPCGYNCCGRFEPERMRLLCGCGEKCPVHKAHQASVDTGIVNRRSKHKAVARRSKCSKRIDLVVPHARLLLRTLKTAETTADRFVADPVEFGFNPFLVQSRCNFTQRRICASLLMRTAVDQ